MRKTSLTTINHGTTGGAFLQAKKRDTMIFRLSELTSDNVYDKKITTFI
jgi:hypothetical protein